MGVYIKGMDMPKDCTECMLNYLDKFGYPRCCMTRLLISYGRTKSDCPLTEVPEPHGPLVDEDLIRERSKYWLVGGADGHTLNDFLNFAEIPTVIERSK